MEGVVAMNDVELVIKLLREVYKDSAAGCCWHILADDGNIERGHVRFCVAECLKHDHPHCRAVMGPMSRLTYTQRAEVYDRYDEYMYAPGVGP